MSMNGIPKLSVYIAILVCVLSIRAGAIDTGGLDIRDMSGSAAADIRESTAGSITDSSVGNTPRSTVGDTADAAFGEHTADSVERVHDGSTVDSPVAGNAEEKEGLQARAGTVVSGNAVPEQSSAVDTVYTIMVEGKVNAPLAAYIERAVSQAVAADPRAILFILDTFGGRVDAALDIVSTITDVTDIHTIAYVKKRAISAGALIALASRELIMREGSTIGDAKPITYSQEGPKELGEKFQSPLRAKFRYLAKRNGYPAALAEAMVTPERKVYRVEMPESTFYMHASVFDGKPDAWKQRVEATTVVVQEGELLTMDNREAVQLGFSSFTVEGLSQLLREKELSAAALREIEFNWSEHFVGFLKAISPLLMMIGLAGIYTELRSPGFGVLGSIGIVCLALVFGANYMVGLADYTELLLIAAGIGLIAVEFFVTPGFGILGGAGIILLLAGMVLSLQGFTIPKPSMPWQQHVLVINIIKVLGSFMGAVIASIVIVRYFFPAVSKVISGPYLSASLRDSRIDSPRVQPPAVGVVGEVKTALRPAGKVRIGDMSYDAVADGEYIQPGENVKVLRTGTRIVVTKVTRE
jgi:membrane-bound serine protease (ClpP class)